LAIAEGLTQSFPRDPRGWIYFCKTLKSVGAIQRAYDIARLKLLQFTENWEFSYDTACYACLLGKKCEAQLFLQRAIELGDPGKLKLLAMHDPDLAALGI